MKHSFLKTVVLFLVAAVLSACGNVNNLDVDKVVKEAVKAQEKLDSYHAEVTHKMVYDGEEEISTYEEWMKKPNKHRMEFNDGMTIVSNGETSWFYEAEANTVMVQENIEEMETGMPNEAAFMTEMIEEMMDHNTIEMKGKEKISGQQTVHLYLTPKEEGTGMFPGEMEIWLDQKTWMPLKMVTKEDGFESEIIYERIEYNKQIDEEIFSFTPPEGAKIETMEEPTGEMPQNMTIEEIQAQVDFQVPEITQLPEGYELQESFYEPEIDMLNLSYSKNNTDMIDLMVTPVAEAPQSAPDFSEAETVMVQGNEAKLMNMNDMLFLSWDNNQLHFELMGMGSDLTPEIIMELAESIQ